MKLTRTLPTAAPGTRASPGQRGEEEDMGIFIVGEWKWQGEGTGPAMKGTRSSYSSSTVTRSECEPDDLGEGMDAAWTGGVCDALL
jgi:hypothetical protein